MPKNWGTVEVTADKFTEVHKSYSGDTIANTKTIRRPFKFQGSLFVSTGGCSGGTSTPQETCYRIVPRQEFKGKATWYGEKLRARTGAASTEDWAEKRRAQAKGFYHGMLIKRGQTEWVLVGPPVVFLRKPGSIDAIQPKLF